MVTPVQADVRHLTLLINQSDRDTHLLLISYVFVSDTV